MNKLGLSDNEIAPALYSVGQILPDGREVLNYSVRRDKAVMLILKSTDCDYVNGFKAARFDVYALPVDKMKANTDLVITHDYKQNLGYGNGYGPNDLNVARHAVDAWIKEQKVV